MSGIEVDIELEMADECVGIDRAFACEVRGRWTGKSAKGNGSRRHVRTGERVIRKMKDGGKRQ